MAWAVFAAVAIVGLADFYKWEYDYGHDLDLENAIIKMPGMTYQPPLIGSRQLLNFRATSIPAPGGYALIVSLALGVVAVVLDWRRKPAEGRSPFRNGVARRWCCRMRALALVLALIATAGCQRVPRPLVAGVDACDFCRMTVSDTRFGGEIQSRTGKIHAFDAVECLASFISRPAIATTCEARGSVISRVADSCRSTARSSFAMQHQQPDGPEPRRLRAANTAPASKSAYGGHA